MGEDYEVALQSPPSPSPAQGRDAHSLSSDRALPLAVLHSGAGAAALILRRKPRPGCVRAERRRQGMNGHVSLSTSSVDGAKGRSAKRVVERGGGVCQPHALFIGESMGDTLQRRTGHL